ncbi:betaine/proline/choline family ABC transporter ATP-binding protein [Rothia sp. AR01]|uniref:ABC-type quaternary amine transporter n=1 Tax=Rothia santali TaxID=2949643 RepID=A0A9X2HHG7_9MICC|nr:betaine/proline/choline family ABC transporter ATP-binding protein [Rothia santali]
MLIENVTKRYGGGKKPAVDQLTLEIPAGQIVMFVGPSGCGKTTTLKMINRLIEPTEGRLIINGEDVTDINGDKLRRKIGYVIQAGGLLPHLTVAANIGLVPKMLGWDKARIAARVDELLDLVSLDVETYRDRYPKELSGGQQQRVGVARALAADPPVLLMDEPFGAVDPITRQRLQDELINIQSELHKTIVCVTHDFDEAVKLGDWIAVFDEGARIVQYDTPEQILANPANEFVENFIGSGAGLKQLNFARVADAELRPGVIGRPDQTPEEVLKLVQLAERRNAVILDERDRPLAWLSREQLSRMDRLPRERDEDLPLVNIRSTLNDALDSMLQASTGSAIVVGHRDQFQGLISVETVMNAIRELRDTAAQREAPVGNNTGQIPRVEGHGRDDAADREPREGAAGSSAAPADADTEREGAQRAAADRSSGADADADAEREDPARTADDAARPASASAEPETTSGTPWAGTRPEQARPESGVENPDRPEGRP